MTTFRDREMSAGTRAEHAALLRAAMQTGKPVAGGVAHDLNSALQILGESLFEIRDDAETPRVSPRTSGDDTRPVLVEAELRAIIALTRQHWMNRLNVTVDIPTPIPEFWCKWWIARLAAMRMVMLAAESQQRTPANFNAERLPTLYVTGSLEGARFELQLRIDQSSSESNAAADSVLTLCAECLHGEVATMVTTTGASLTSLSYPVRLAAA